MAAAGQVWQVRITLPAEDLLEGTLDAAACCPLFLLTCALLMTSSHSKAADQELDILDLNVFEGDSAGSSSGGGRGGGGGGGPARAAGAGAGQSMDDGPDAPLSANTIVDSLVSQFP